MTRGHLLQPEALWGYGSEEEATLSLPLLLLPTEEGGGGPVCGLSVLISGVCVFGDVSRLFSSCVLDREEP